MSRVPVACDVERRRAGCGPGRPDDDEIQITEKRARASPVGQIFELAEATCDAPGSRNTFQPVAAETFSRTGSGPTKRCRHRRGPGLLCQQGSGGAASPGTLRKGEADDEAAAPKRETRVMMNMCSSQDESGCNTDLVEKLRGAGVGLGPFGRGNWRA